ncbi:hypothetical protein JL721_2084 [Aureococcus anophagefferens]|nr:hypothetical protein JL721_2084 [Aureococcus anophagefferens]
MFTLAKSLALLPVVAASPLRLGTFTESIPPYQRWSEETRSISGGAPRMSDLIFDAMGFDVEIVDLGSFRDAQAKSIAALDRGEIDIAWAYGPQRLRWPAGFHLTEPILTVDRRAMVRKETRTSRPTFSIFQPFERNLWLAIVGAIVVAAGVFYVLDLLWHEETPSSHSFLYHAAALLLRGEEYVTFSPASRWFRVGFLFTALILTATYTESIAACERRLDAGEVDVVVLDWIFAGQQSLRRCDERLLLNLPLPGVRVGFVTASAALAANVSVAVDAAKYEAEYLRTMVDYFDVDRSCEVAAADVDELPKISLRDIHGLFYILAGFAVGAVANACLHKRGCHQKSLDCVVHTLF